MVSSNPFISTDSDTHYQIETSLNLSLNINFFLLVSQAEDSNFVKDETDVKPTVLPPPTDVDQVEDVKVALDLMQSCSSPSSEATASTGDLLVSCLY